MSDNGLLCLAEGPAQVLRFPAKPVTDTGAVFPHPLFTRLAAPWAGGGMSEGALLAVFFASDVTERNSGLGL